MGHRAVDSVHASTTPIIFWITKKKKRYWSEHDLNLGIKQNESTAFVPVSYAPTSQMCTAIREQSNTHWFSNATPIQAVIILNYEFLSPSFFVQDKTALVPQFNSKENGPTRVEISLVFFACALWFSQKILLLKPIFPLDNIVNQWLAYNVFTFQNRSLLLSFYFLTRRRDEFLFDVTVF